jgi:hypothetical protein
MTPINLIMRIIPRRTGKDRLRMANCFQQSRRVQPGNANLPIGDLHDAIRENGVPGESRPKPGQAVYCTEYAHARAS